VARTKDEADLVTVLCHSLDKILANTLKGVDITAYLLAHVTLNDEPANIAITELPESSKRLLENAS
jgi:hypothetical protein